MPQYEMIYLAGSVIAFVVFAAMLFLLVETFPELRDYRAGM